MNTGDIRNLLSERHAQPMDAGRFYAVLLPLVDINKEAHILYEVRAKSLKVQPGEICFPGGAIEEGETTEEAAVRETCEELNLSPGKIEIFKPLDYLVKTGGYVLYPFAGRLDINTCEITINKNEVETFFTIPISYLMNYIPEEHKISYKIHTEDDFPYDKINGGADYKWRSIGYRIPFYEYEGKVIWGMTARITKNFIDRLKNGG